MISTDKASTFRSAETASLFESAVRAHQAGQLREAEQLYRRLLAADPKHADALHLLGVLAHQCRSSEVAVDLIGKALALSEPVPEFHYNIGLAYGALGRMDDAARHNRRAIALRPDYAEAHLNLGNALNAQKQHADALESYRRALALRPGSPQLHFNIANVLAALGETGEAIAQYRAALALAPNYAEAHNNLGAALATNNALAEAAACFRRALALKGDLPGTALGLARVLLALGDPENALVLARRLQGAGETAETRALFFLCLRDPRATPFAATYRAELARAISDPWGDPRALAGLVADLLSDDALIAPLIARAGESSLAGLSAGDLSVLAGDDLLQAALRSVQIPSAGVERLLTRARRALLEAAAEPSDSCLALACALAEQCFINEYVFAFTEHEAERLRTLGAALARGPATAFGLAVYACYAPLHTIAEADALLNAEWPAPVRALLNQQIAEPAEEERIRATIPRLTAIEDAVSQVVRAQYEENPYPRWTRTASFDPAKSVDTALHERFGGRYRPLRPAGNAVEYLIAGCGTGRQVAGVKLAFSDAKITAIDLSLASLGYARRKTDALGFRDVRYGQADILQLGSLGKTFDVVDSAGVLHHMGDPTAGWRELIGLLRPGGVMRIALYSTLARRDIAAVRRLIAAQDYPATADGIRAARQAVLALPVGTPGRNVATWIDFFTLSECRDLVFHVQEHTFELPAIAAFLDANGLAFLGFDISPDVAQRYAERFPADAPKTNLANWSAFEQDHPETFIAMYQFWAQKAA